MQNTQNTFQIDHFAATADDSQVWIGDTRTGATASFEGAEAGDLAISPDTLEAIAEHFDY
jgi:hypothetical protein